MRTPHPLLDRIFIDRALTDGTLIERALTDGTDAVAKRPGHRRSSSPYWAVIVVVVQGPKSPLSGAA